MKFLSQIALILAGIAIGSPLFPPAASGQEPEALRLQPEETEAPERANPDELVMAEPLPTPAPSRALTRVGLRLEGNTRFNEEEIRTAIADQLSAIEESGLSPALADDTAFFLGIYYRKHGYSQAEVGWSIRPGNLLVLTIAEGPLTRLGSISFVGNRQIPSSTLLEYITGTTSERLPTGQHAIPFVEGDVQSAVERIRGLYLSEGYLDSIVDEPQITLSADKTSADVVVAIHEGIQYRFGALTFEGDLIFKSMDDLLKELEVFTSKPYTPLAVTNMERKVAYYYRTKGYFKVKVRTESDPMEAVDGKVPVRFFIEAGDFYRFDGVTQKGLKKLRPSFLKNRFKSLQGKPYNPAQVEKRYRTLMATGLFSNLRLTQKALPNHEVQLHFDVQEAKARELGFSVGYGSLEGAILGARYLDRNLLGFGRPISFNAEIAQNMLRGEVLYTDPWVLDTDYTLRLRLYALSQDLKDYSKTESGFRAELSREIGKHLEVSAFLLARAVQIDNTGNIEPSDLGPTSYFANSIGTSLTLDYRDSVLNPSKGLVINATADVALGALGSSLDFARSTARISYYLPVGKTLFAVGLRGGIIVPVGQGDEIPIDERFFNGGSRSVRSYVERSLGPKDDGGHSIGGETFTTFNIENVFPIYENLKGAVFFDAGSVGRRVGTGLGVTGYAVGLGLRYALPIGPIRIDYGFNPVRKEGEPSGAWNFSFGFAF